VREAWPWLALLGLGVTVSILEWAGSLPWLSDCRSVSGLPYGELYRQLPWAMRFRSESSLSLS
jgi:hypothetical protein